MPRSTPERLRNDVRRIDLEILALARRRTELTRRIGEWKLVHGLPVRDFRTEREALASADRWCRRHDLDSTMGREIVRCLMTGAAKVQEDLRERRYEGTKKTICVLGGRGKMGSWFARYLHSRGHRVVVHDPAGPLRRFPSTRSLGKAVREADIVLLATPLHNAPEVLREVRAQRPSGTIVDLFSLKTPVLPEIRRCLDGGLAITSIHPLFGPDVYLLSDRTLVLCPCGHRAADAAVKELFTGTSLEIVRIPVEDHDRIMGIGLGLSHMVNIVFTEALVRHEIPYRDLRRVATTTFLKQARNASEVARENARLYYDIQHENRYSAEVYRVLQQALRTFRQAAASGRSDAFVQMMERGKEFYGDRRRARRSRF